jgi:thiol-disulfide isomerase/thioredoxin
MIQKNYVALCHVDPGAVLVKMAQAVVVLALASAGLTSGCTRAAQEPPAGSAPPTASPDASAGPAEPRPKRLAGIAGASGIAAVTPSPSSTPASVPAGAPAAVGSSAYPGCGLPIPSARLWDETTESEVLDAISAAKACAAAHDRRLLLEFVAPWCADCQEMAKLDEAPIVASMLEQRFERVRVNVGKWDRHEALRDNFGVRALATYIVIDPKTSKLLAKTTLEPISRPGQKLSAEQWARWLKAH